MALGVLDLDALARRMANRDTQRTEATVQSDLHALLLAAPLDLDEPDLKDITLEQQAGARKRIDVEAGLCVFEVKRDLRKGNVRADAVIQLADYVERRTKDMDQRYVGVLTDGAEWRLFHLVGGRLQEVSSFLLDAEKPQVDALTVWLEGVLATAEKIKPTPHEIHRRLGASSSGHELDRAEVRALFEKGRAQAGVKLKKELWARLLTTAFGTGFVDSDELFIEHTLLVVTAEIVAHAVVGLDPTRQDVSAATMLSGHLFSDAQVHGVVDADFFDWLVEVDGGERFVKALARRLTRFAWQEVEHDVLKVLYESVISTDQRKKLGEYYTPDWLAERVVAETVSNPLHQRVLDPSCGSGTFLFHAIRRYLSAAAQIGTAPSEAVAAVTSFVVGMDIHPVAVTFARVTYLLAIGTERLRAADRLPLSIPVYLGDSIQWGQERTLFTANALVVPTTNTGDLWTTDLRFPASALGDAGQFDRLVSELADLASLKRAPGGPVPSLAAVFRRYSIPDPDQAVVTETFRTMCRLHDNGRNHIWGYYVRNLARPYWLTRDENRVDVLVGNPPWLAYRHMTPEMQKEFRALSEERGLWAGSTVATHQDLSTLFVLRTIERYLNEHGSFGFVLPWSVLRGRQFEGFRRGRYELRSQMPFALKFKVPWDLHRVKPAFFPVPASVIAGERAPSGTPTSLPEEVDAWSGKLPRVNIAWAEAEPHIERNAGAVHRAHAVGAKGSPYAARFAQGATFVPRVLVVVEEKPVGPLGAGAGRITVQSRRSANEKAPWKTLQPLEGSVDRQFVKPLHLGDTVLPFRALPPSRAIVPWDGSRLLDASDERLPLYPGLAEWWTKAEALWNNHRKSKTLTLKQRLDYQRGLTNQLPLVLGAVRVVYTKSGMYLAAAIITDDSVIDHKLYWGTVSSMDEGRYLVAILNSDFLTKAVRPLQARGQHNPRDFDKYVWQLPVPAYDAANATHLRLAVLGGEAEKIAAGVSLSPGKKFETLRRVVREVVSASECGKEIEVLVKSVFQGSDGGPT